MNIFVVDNNPEIAARMLCDKHVVKMILESAQLLSTTLQILGYKTTYKKTHENHPCAKWTRESLNNYIWLKRHGIELCKEYTRRYGKTHKTEKIFLTELIEPSNLESKGLTKFVMAMPDEYKNDNPVIAYRKYYIKEKSKIAKWKLNNIPEWFLEN